MSTPGWYGQLINQSRPTELSRAAFHDPFPQEIISSVLIPSFAYGNTHELNPYVQSPNRSRCGKRKTRANQAVDRTLQFQAPAEVSKGHRVNVKFRSFHGAVIEGSQTKLLSC